MRETEAELARLQEVIDASYERGGSHLLHIHSPEHRLSATQVTERLTGMRLLALATVTADGRPIVGPVDAFLLHGAFHFGSSPESVRARHIRARPQVSATHLPGEELAVTVHGRALPVPVTRDSDSELREVLLAEYVPRYGADWADMLDRGAIYWRIEPERMFTFYMPAGDAAA